MNLKLNNDVRGSQNVLKLPKSPSSSVKEERRRTGRYIAILVGICLFLLAMYHAWVRRIPFVASLVVPALIMFVYVAWVLYTASRDKHKLLELDAEAALGTTPDAIENDAHITELQNNEFSSKESSKVSTPDGSIYKEWFETTSPIIYKENVGKIEQPRFIMPLILINDKLPEDFDQKWQTIVESVSNNDKLKSYSIKRRYKRKFCRRKHAVFKRSYSIA